MMTTRGDEVSGVEFSHGQKDPCMNDLLTIYKFYQDAASLFDRRRAKELESSLLMTCVRLGVDMNEVHKAWKEYRMDTCSKLGNKLSNPGLNIPEVTL